MVRGREGEREMKNVLCGYVWDVVCDVWELCLLREVRWVCMMCLCSCLCLVFGIGMMFARFHV